MANVLSNLAADIYKAADIVGREAVGFIPAVTINSGSEQAAQGDTVRSFATRAVTVNTSATPSMTIPEGDDQTIDTKTMTISQIASVRIPWTGEDIKHVNNGSGFETIYGDQIKQAFRGIVNTIENHVATVAYQNASRAFGTAGTTPFGSNFDEVAEMRQILVDNGIPMDGRVSLVVNTSAGTNLRQLAQLQKVNEAGGAEMLRNGTLLDLQGFMLKESAQVIAHTKGTGTSYQSNNASGYAVGDKTVALDTGSGTVLAGDVVTFTGDTNKYVVNTALSGGSLAIGAPGLRAALADNIAMTIGNNYRANIALHQSAVELAMRPLAKPQGGDAAVDEMIVQDPFSGLVFRISAYKGYNKAMFDVTCLYQAKAWNPHAIATLLG
ncbi:P22 phage major capsid protein family protein [Rhizobium alvei]|uniref:P22 phage major capsid protein family protein n=1 Tax=Rhizobium alvei TaxID=1132659 RepID=A0ABT8YT74_9HYPH|nr:P22 phage major capsid protein family protein [Rhizobium alvei]MDO6966976.1 P22 phage major capsid protein family protein [Rhizobium alvei]